MTLGFIGLGRMGKNMVLRLLEKKHRVVAYARSVEAIQSVESAGAVGAYSVGELVGNLRTPRVIWLMITAGKPINDVLASLLPLLSKGDTVIDGGNSFYKDSQQRAQRLAKINIHFLDVGTSGGVDGARHGACMMIGGPQAAFKKTEPLYRDMCVKDGYGYMGVSGAGHFVKMVHNGIEYGMMGAIAEGIQAIHKHSKRLGIDVEKATEVYAHGSIIESRLLSWVVDGMKRKDFESIVGSVPKGETEEEMERLEQLTSMKMLTVARLMRAATRKKPSFSGKLLATMRNEFGGHALLQHKSQKKSIINDNC